MNKSGKVNVTNIKGKKPVAVTWGVFPGKKLKKVYLEFFFNRL